VRRDRGDDELVIHQTGLVTLTYRRRDLEDVLAESAEETPSSGADAPASYVEIDDAYFDEVRRAVGGGTPTVLLGTSTKSLEAELLKLKAAYAPQSKTSGSRSDPPPTTRPPESGSRPPESPAQPREIRRRARRWLRGVLLPWLLRFGLAASLVLAGLSFALGALEGSWAVLAAGFVAMSAAILCAILLWRYGGIDDASHSSSSTGTVTQTTHSREATTVKTKTTEN
jgi:hypothetical protein